MGSGAQYIITVSSDLGPFLFSSELLALLSYSTVDLSLLESQSFKVSMGRSWLVILLRSIVWLFGGKINH
jgi:hypothetical protein